MKTINFELSKRLNDLWLLDDIETEYFYYKPYKDKDKWHIWPNSIVYWIDRWDIKTLTLEEAIEFLPKKLEVETISFQEMILFMNKNEIWYYCRDLQDTIINYIWKTLLEAIENMITYLLDNNLLTKDNIWKQQ